MFVVVATVNAVNFVDGLDGLAAGVVGIGALAFFLFCYQLAALNNVSLATTGALLSAALAGACVGFLPHNVHPARLFMGDSGSMLIGLFLSASAITLTGQFPVSAISQGAFGTDASWAPMLLPLPLPVAILMLPLVDLVLAVVRRTRAGPVPVRPGQAAPAPPDARDRPLPPQGGVHHVDVGGADRVRHRDHQPLHGAVDVGRARGRGDLHPGRDVPAARRPPART